MSDPQHSPAAERNRQPILEVLRNVLPAEGMALEIASGTGQHIAWFAAGLPDWIWQPSEAQADSFASIVWWCEEAAASNVRPPVVLDVMTARWPSDDAVFSDPIDVIYCANLLHISPWATCAALMLGASRYLSANGRLITYGPYLERNVQTTAGNLDFDASLRETDPEWGIRRLDDVTQQAALAGLQLSARIQMPANNLLLVFKRKHLVDVASR